MSGGLHLRLALHISFSVRVRILFPSKTRSSYCLRVSPHIHSKHSQQFHLLNDSNSVVKMETAGSLRGDLEKV